jgi:hypothetical protein
VEALNACEGEIRAIAKGEGGSALHAQYTAMGGSFKHITKRGPFQTEEQGDALIEVLEDWFPGRGNQVLRNHVLLEEAFHLIVKHIKGCTTEEAAEFMAIKIWLTTGERKKLSRGRKVDSGNDSSDVDDT